MTGINLKGLNITSTIVPTNSADVFPTHDSLYGKGGWREVNTIAERDNIPKERRKEGMVVYVRETFRNYQLQSTLSNAGWTVFPATTDVSAIINEAINQGQINIDLTAYYNKGEIDTLLIDYAKKEDVLTSLTTAAEDIQTWVTSQGYLTEHQSLADYLKADEITALLENYALRSEVEQLADAMLTKTEAAEIYVVKAITSDTGTAYVWNETSGGGARYEHTDGSRSAVCVNNGGADSIAAQIYAIDYSTKFGTRINIFNKGAYYIPNMSSTDAEYEIDGEQYEIAVKGDIPSLEGYVTQEEALAELAKYVTKEEALTELEKYVTKEEGEAALANYVTIADGQAELEKYVTKDEALAELEKYVTEEEALAELEKYATKEEVATEFEKYVTKEESEAELANYVTKEESETTLANYVTKEEVSAELAKYPTIEESEAALENYVTKEESETALANYVTKEEAAAEHANFVTRDEVTSYIESVDLSGYATTEYVDTAIAGIEETDLSNYLTKDEIAATYVTSETLAEQVDAITDNYEALRDNVSLIASDYVTKEDLTDYVTQTALDEKLADYATSDDIADFVTEEALSTELENYLKKGDLSGDAGDLVTAESLAETLAAYATVESLSAYASINLLNVTLEDYMTADAIQELLDNYATKAYVDEKLADYVTSDDLTTTLGDYATRLELQTVSGNALTAADLQEQLANYLLKDDLAVTLANYATQSDITTALADYATRLELQIVAGNAVTNTTLQATLSNYITNSALASLIADYLTLSDVSLMLSSYVTKTDLQDAIKDLITVSDLQGYATESWVKDYLVTAGYLLPSDLSSYATQNWVGTYISNYVTSNGLIKVTDLQGYATETWVKDYVLMYGGSGSGSSATVDLESYQKVTDTSLETTDKTIVGAINEINAKVTEIADQTIDIDLSAYQTKEDETLETTDKTIVGAINELANKTIDAYTKEEIDEKLATIEETAETGISEVKESIETINTTLETKADKDDVSALEVRVMAAEETLVTKADQTTVDEAITTVSEALLQKANASDLENVVKYLDFTYNDEARKTIQLANYDSISGVDTSGAGHNLVMISKWDVADFGATGVHMNLNTLDNVTINDDKVVATVDDIQEAIAEATYTKEEINELIEQGTVSGDFVTTTEFNEFAATLPDTYVVKAVTSDTGTAYVWNEKSGGGARYEHVDGSKSFVGVNNGGADDIAVQVYAKNDSTAVGTRINVYNKGAYYIPNMSNADANYVADAEGREIAVKEDITAALENYATVEYVAEQIENIQVSVDDIDLTEYLKIADAAETYTTLETFNALDDVAVKYQEFTYNDETRKTIQLANYDSISGIGTDGEGYNLAMVSKWNVADFGSPSIHLNLNTSDVVTVNDTDSVLTTGNVVAGDNISINVDVDTMKCTIAADLSEYVKAEALEAKADVADTLAGYGITDAYTKEEVDTIIANVEAGESQSFYTKEEVDTFLAGKQDTGDYVIQNVASDTGTAVIWNEKSGGGARYDHVDGSKSFVGVNNGGADDIAVQIYAKNDATAVGTRINVYNKGAYYIPNMSNTAAEYDADGDKYEIAVKGDIDAAVEEINETINNIQIADLNAYTKEEVNALLEGKQDTGNYVIQSITSDTGTAYVWNETSGGGARYEHTDGTWSFTGVNNGGADGIGVQTYVKDNNTSVGTRINVYTKGAYYLPNMSLTDANENADNTSYEIAVKGDIESAVTNIKEQITDIQSTFSNIYTKEEVDAILAGEEVTLTEYLKIADAAELYETKEAVAAGLATKQDAGDYVIQSIASSTGTAYVWNETSGGGARYDHTDGSRSFVGVNNGGADDIAAQIYAKNNSTNVGTRINIYNKGAYYIPNMSNTDAAYVADGEQYEIAVKGDIPSLEGYATTEYVESQISSITLDDYVTKAEYDEKVSSLEATITNLQEIIQQLQNTVTDMLNTIQAPQYLIVGEDSQNGNDAQEGE